MKYLLSYRKFCDFNKEWEILDIDTDKLIFRKGRGLTRSNVLQSDGKEGYTGTVSTIEGGFLDGYCLSQRDIVLKKAGRAGDGLKFSLPIKYHMMPLYCLHYKGTVKQCIIVNEVIYYELKTQKFVR